MVGEVASEMPGEAAGGCASELPGGAAGGAAGEAANERVGEAANDVQWELPCQWNVHVKDQLLSSTLWHPPHPCVQLNAEILSSTPRSHQALAAKIHQLTQLVGSFAFARRGHSTGSTLKKLKSVENDERK